MKLQVSALILLLQILDLTAAELLQISSNKTTTISRERNSLFIDYFNLLVNTHDQLQDKVNTLDSSNKILGAQLVDAESKIVNDTSVIISKDQEIKDQQNEIKKRDDQVKDKNEQLLLKDEQIKEKSDILDLQDEQINLINAELNEREEGLNKMTEVKQKLQNQLLVCKGEVKEQSEVINVREKQIEKANELLKKQDEQINNKCAELRASEENVFNLTDTIQNLQSQLDMEIETHNDQIQIKVNEIGALTYQIQNKDDIIFNMTETIQSLKSQLVNTETQIKEKSSLINSKDEDIKKQGEQLKVNNEQFSKQKEQFSKENEQLRAQNKQLLNKCEQLKQKDELLVTLNNEINIQREQIKNNEVKISSLNNHIASVTSELTDKTNQLLTCTGFQRCPKGLPNGISSIILPGEQAFEAPCNSSGWMTIQKRFDGTEPFNRSWANYKQGFGNLRGEFFMGLENLHQLTKAQPQELLIYLGDQYGKITYAHYDNFQIGSEEESYYLKSLGSFSGTTANGLRDNLGMKFSTYDRDNDLLVSECAKHLGGAWWFNKCGSSSLNGQYYENGGSVAGGIFWPILVGGKWRNNISYTYVKMMIKPKDY